MKMYRFLLAALLVVLAPGVALAQHDRAMGPHDKGLLPQLCLQLCYTAINLCAPGVAMDDPACVTRRVVCPSTCNTCLSGREECGSDAAKFSACLMDYGACIRSQTVERAKSHPLVSFKGGDGATKDSAVVISGARDENEGAAGQAAWSVLRHPDWKKKNQKRASVDGRAFDTVDYDTPKGPAQAWFDVSEFAGKGDAPQPGTK